MIAQAGRDSGVPVLVFGPGGDVDAPVFISNDEDPARAARAKKDASIVLAAKAVAEGRADALVSAGSTGGALATSLFEIKRIRGVHRPAIAVLLPLPGKPVLMLDAGANVEVRPEHLVQFAYMGAAFMQAAHGVERPRVGLLSVGSEPKKGTPDVVEAHARLVEGPLHFVGNVEGTGLTEGEADVVVTDGFTGNVALKLMEGTARTVVRAVRDAVKSGAVSSVGGLLIKGKVGALREQFDPDSVGGAILLGLRKPVVIAHGASSAVGIQNAVRVARRAVDERAVERTEAAMRAAGVLRSGAVASVDGES